jgi:hypothetical protein
MCTSKLTAKLERSLEEVTTLHTHSRIWVIRSAFGRIGTDLKKYIGSLELCGIQILQDL